LLHIGSIVLATGCIQTAFSLMMYGFLQDYIDELRQETAGARAKEDERREVRQGRLDLLKKKAEERRQKALR
jgi:hypothetical protein